MASFDPDHALAILLQAKFNEEAKKAREKDKENLPVSIIKPVMKTSLIDPEWEVTDPCPDIHGLFMAFNERFFWRRLSAVEVKWSPQMTSCAGICVYQGRNGLCSVRLSAPLLKLRPRSDLVETLLHEMIHAYLFVTNNNRDRDGHGPEFHKHMYRINKEAGTNITVYHSFHAEVKVYQQHWWRCNGPCQHRAPFFGMVKRARNRAPGPNDIWWDTHRAACGGQFIKVREPEDYNKKKKGKEAKAIKSKDGKDIRSFLNKPSAVNGGSVTTITNNKVGSNIFGFNKISSNSVSETKVKPSMGENSVNRVTGFGDLSSFNRSSAVKGKSTNIFGKGHVLGRGTQGSPKTTIGSSSTRGRGRGGMLANRGGGTLVVTGSKGRNKPAEDSLSPNTKLRIDNFKPFSGSGHALGSSSSGIDRSKSRLLSIDQQPERKKQKINEENDLELSEISDAVEITESEDNDRMCKCSVCNKSILREEVDVHLESCVGLQNIFNNSTAVDLADENEISDINNKYKITACPVCDVNIEGGDINSHLNECLNTSGIINVFDEPPIEISDCDSPIEICDENISKPETDNDSDVEIIESENRVACPICGMRFGESKINSHVNQCLDSED